MTFEQRTKGTEGASCMDIPKSTPEPEYKGPSIQHANFLKLQLSITQSPLCNGYMTTETK